MNYTEKQMKKMLDHKEKQRRFKHTSIKKARRMEKIKRMIVHFVYIILAVTVISLFISLYENVKKENLKPLLIPEANAQQEYRDNARLARLTECNSRIDMLTEYNLNNQDIGTRCATIRTLSKDNLPYQSIMEDIHTPSGSDSFWEVYYDIKRIRIENWIGINTEMEQEPEGFDIYKLARAVAMHETANFTLWYGKTHNNWQGIKHGNTVPCPWVAKMAMCKFSSQQESHEAFVKIWSTWYGEMPTYEMAVRWSGDDRASEWLSNVTYFYNEQ